ncbi:MAG: hypothetical protein AB4050_19135 [Synechococcus sp.]
MKLFLWSLFISLNLLFPAQARAESSQTQANANKSVTIVDKVAQTIQVVSVAVGVVISVLSFTNAQLKDAKSRRAEAAKPFLDLRQKLYLEAVQAAAVLSNTEVHTSEEITIARKRFRQLYVAELSLVEARGVESSMVELARLVDPELEPLNPERQAAYKLSHALRDSLIKSWNLDEEIVDNTDEEIVE